MSLPPLILDIRGRIGAHVPVADRSPEFRPAAVLIPLFLREGALHLLLTRRTDEVEHHKGQMSFPGGMADDGDNGPEETALREAEEEVGLGRCAVEVLGRLSDIVIPSGFRVTPVVGFLPELPVLRPHAAEVAEIVTVPLAFFADERNVRTAERERNGRRMTVYRYQYGPYDIWGATAAMIRTFLAVAGPPSDR